jgi:tRNA nucleotidyltransferase (CCA-adding enzyme)
MNALEEHIQWNTVKDVCTQLREAGYQALLAGGCVRDLIMHRKPNDFDIATDATPDQVEELFPKSVAVGKAFGVIILPFENFQIEVATFREDLQYKDGRRPEGVTFSTPEADAQRRDFTVNALFYDPIKKEVIDFVNGRKDITAKLLRAVGKADLRFDEDKLRILRAIRFSAQLDFEIEPQTLRAITSRASEISVVSLERIRDELLKLLKSPKRLKGLELLMTTGVLKGAMPELAKEIEKHRQEWLRAFAHLETEDDLTALIALFVWPAHQNPHAILHSILKEFRFDKQLNDELIQILRSLDTVLNPSSIRSGELAYLMTKSFAPSLLCVAGTLVRSESIAHELYGREAWNAALKAARPDGETPTQPLITGKDLMKMGMKPGPQMGERLHEIFLLQLEGQLTSRADVEKWLTENQ